MAQNTQHREDDERVLGILHVIDTEGTAAARREFGLSNGAVQSYRRYLKAADAIPCRCKKRKNKDGGMKPRWWA